MPADHHPLEVTPQFAERLNALVASQGAGSGESLSPGGLPRAAGGGDPPAAVVQVRNDTDELLPRYSVIGLGDPLITPETDDVEYRTRPAFKGESIEEDNQRNFAIVQLPLDRKEIDYRAIVAGCSMVRLIGPSDQQYADTVEGESTLTAGPEGRCTILYDPGSPDDEDEEAERTALVMIGGLEPSPLTLLISGSPSSGRLILEVAVTDADDPETVTTEDVEILIPSTLPDIKEAFESHSAIEVDQVIPTANGVADDNTTTEVLPDRPVFLALRNGLTRSRIEITSKDESEMLGGIFVPYAQIG